MEDGQPLLQSLCARCECFAGIREELLTDVRIQIPATPGWLPSRRFRCAVMTDLLSARPQSHLWTSSLRAGAKETTYGPALLCSERVQAAFDTADWRRSTTGLSRRKAHFVYVEAYCIKCHVACYQCRGPSYPTRSADDFASRLLIALCSALISGSVELTALSSRFTVSAVAGPTSCKADC